MILFISKLLNHFNIDRIQLDNLKESYVPFCGKKLHYHLTNSWVKRVLWNISECTNQKIKKNEIKLIDKRDGNTKNEMKHIFKKQKFSWEKFKI